MGAFEFLRKGLPFRDPHRGAPEVADPAERLRRQHQELRQQLDRTRSWFTQPAGGGERRERVRTITELEVLLIDHFQLEETGGYMADALRLAPQYSGRAEALRTQHTALALEMRSLRELCEICGRSKERWAELDARLASFTKRLRTHERAENEIASDALLEDIGTQD